jgi:ATP-binding cassette, subfamily C (CFTR/MRP), member 1
MSSVGPCLNDDSLGPAVRGCRGNFDFTVAFEDVVFVIVPAIAFLCLGLSRILRLCRCRRPIVGASAIQWTKLVCTLIPSSPVNEPSCLEYMSLIGSLFITM